MRSANLAQRAFLLAVVAAIICAASASASTTLAQTLLTQPGFTYDHQLAVDLGRAYGNEMARVMAASMPGRLDLDHPTVIARTFKGDRRLVQVSYRSSYSRGGAVVVLALCREGLLTWVDSTFWDGARTSRVKEFADADSNTIYAGNPDRCPRRDGLP